MTLSALLLMCSLSAHSCKSDEARQIASAIDSATDDDRLRSVLVTYAWLESRWQLTPRPESWDAKAGIARGPWQLWHGGDADLAAQARTWLALVQRGGLAALDSSPVRASRRAAFAQRLLDRTSALDHVADR